MLRFLRLPLVFNCAMVSLLRSAEPESPVLLASPSIVNRTSASSKEAETTLTSCTTGGCVSFNVKKMVPPRAQAIVGTNNCETGCTEAARNAARIGPKMNTISSMADSMAYAVFNSSPLPVRSSTYAQRVRTSAPNENCVRPITTASMNSNGIGTRTSAANAKPSMVMICTTSTIEPTLRWPNRSNSRAYSGVTAAVASTYAALITPAIVQLSYRWLSARIMPRPIIDIGSRAKAPEAQNALVPGMENNTEYGDFGVSVALVAAMLIAP